MKAAAFDLNVPNIDETFSDSFSLWQNIELDKAVSEYLGIAYKAFKNTVSAYEDCIKSIASKLDGLNRPVNVSNCPLLLPNEVKAAGMMRFWQPKLAYSHHESSIWWLYLTLPRLARTICWRY